MNYFENITESLNNIINLVLDILKESISAYPDDLLLTLPNLKFHSSGVPTLKKKKIPNFGLMVPLILFKLRDNSVYSSFCDKLNSDDSVKSQLDHMIGAGDMFSRIDCERILDKTIDRYLNISDFNVEYDKPSFDKVVRELHHCLYDQEIQITHTAILENFKMDMDRVQIQPDLMILKSIPNDVENLWSNNYTIQNQYPIGSTYSNPSQIGGLIEITTVENKIILSESENAQSLSQTHFSIALDKIKIVLNVLRLLKAGNIRIGPILTHYDNWLIGPDSSSIYPKNEIPGPFKYHLESCDINNLIQMAIGLIKINKSDNSHNIALKTGIRRLGMATERSQYEDQIIDVIIALEAMILPGIDGERGYKLRLFTSLLIANDSKERREIFGILNEAYGIRSKVVHGETLDRTDEEVISKTMDICRRTARKLVGLQINNRGFPQWDALLFP